MSACRDPSEVFAQAYADPGSIPGVSISSTELNQASDEEPTEPAIVFPGPDRGPAGDGVSEPEATLEEAIPTPGVAADYRDFPVQLATPAAPSSTSRADISTRCPGPSATASRA